MKFKPSQVKRVSKTSPKGSIWTIQGKTRGSRQAQMQRSRSDRVGQRPPRPDHGGNQRAMVVATANPWWPLLPSECFGFLGLFVFVHGFPVSVADCL